MVITNSITNSITIVLFEPYVNFLKSPTVYTGFQLIAPSGLTGRRENYSRSSLIRTPVIRTLANPNSRSDCSIRVFCQLVCVILE